MDKSDKIYVAGHRGMVGSAIVRNLQSKGYSNIVGRSHKELDLTSQADVTRFFEEERPDIVVLAAAKVGGINANQTKPAEFAYENMQVQCNVIKCCHDFQVKKLLFLGSTWESCKSKLSYGPYKFVGIQLMKSSPYCILKYLHISNPAIFAIA